MSDNGRLLAYDPEAALDVLLTHGEPGTVAQLCRGDPDTCVPEGQVSCEWCAKVVIDDRLTAGEIERALRLNA